MASRLERLSDRQYADMLDAETGEERTLITPTRALVTALSDSIIRLEDAGATDLGDAQLRALLAQTQSEGDRLKVSAFLALLSLLNDSRAMGAGHALDLVATAEPTAGIAVDGIVTMGLQAAADGVAEKAAVDRYASDVVQRVQRSLVASRARQATLREARKALADKAAGPTVLPEAQGAAIVRVQVNTAYNDGQQIALEAVSDATEWANGDDPLMKRADETIDKKNHPISRVLDGMAVPIDEPFRVSVVQVKAELAKMNASRPAKKSGGKRKPLKLSGVLWPEIDGYYVGRYAAHYGERGRQTPFRRSWGG